MKIKEKVLIENRNVEISKWTATEREFQISQGKAEDARIATLYHPNWKASVNGINTQIKLNKDGAMLIPIPEKSAKISLSFQEPLLLQIAKLFSLLTWLIIFSIILTSVHRRIKD